MFKHSHFGVYALILDDSNKKILLIKKARGPYTGLYDLPGGSPEETELIEETLERELLEETGCNALNYTQLGGFSTRYSYHKDGEDALLRHLGIIYRVEISGTPKTDSDGQDSHGCVWLDLSEINSANATPFVLTAAKLSDQ